MKFGFINLAAAVLVCILLIPNLIYAVKGPKRGETAGKKGILILEQLGRYVSILLMVLPLWVWEFGFRSVFLMLLYFLGNGVLTITYLAVWVFYFRFPTRRKAMALAILPTGIFLLSGLSLRHWLLVCSSLLFGFTHIYITWQNNKRTV